MDTARKLLLGLAVVSIAFGAWMLFMLTGLGPWFAVGVGSAAVFVLAGSHLVTWAFGSRRIDRLADDDFASLALTATEPADKGAADLERTDASRIPKVAHFRAPPSPFASDGEGR